MSFTGKRTLGSCSPTLLYSLFYELRLRETATCLKSTMPSDGTASFTSLVWGRLSLAFSQAPENKYNCAICSKEGSYSPVEYFLISKILQNAFLKVKEIYLLCQCLCGFHSLRRANAGSVYAASVKCCSLA